MGKKKPSVIRTDAQSREETSVRAAEQSQEALVRAEEQPQEALVRAEEQPQEASVQADEQSQETPVLAKEPSQETQALTEEQIQAIRKEGEAAGRKAGYKAGAAVAVGVNAIAVGTNYALSQNMDQNLSKAKILSATVQECYSKLVAACQSSSLSNASSSISDPSATNSSTSPTTVDIPILPLIPTTLQAFCESLPADAADEILGQCHDLTSLMANTRYSSSQLSFIAETLSAMQDALNENLRSVFAPLGDSFLREASQKLAACSGEGLTQASANACGQLAYGLVSEFTSPDNNLASLSNITDILRKETLTLADVEAIRSQCQNIVSELPDLQQHCTTLMQEAAKKTAYSESLLLYLSWLATQSRDYLAIPLAKGVGVAVKYTVFKPTEYLAWLLEQGTDVVKNHISSEGVKQAGESLAQVAMENPYTTVAIAGVATGGVTYYNRERIKSGVSYVRDGVSNGLHKAKSAGGNTLSYMYNGLHRNTVGRFASPPLEEASKEEKRSLRNS